MDTVHHASFRVALGCMSSTPSTVVLSEASENPLSFRRSLLANTFILRNFCWDNSPLANKLSDLASVARFKIFRVNPDISVFRYLHSNLCVPLRKPWTALSARHNLMIYETIYWQSSLSIWTPARLLGIVHLVSRSSMNSWVLTFLGQHLFSRMHRLILPLDLWAADTTNHHVVVDIGFEWETIQGVSDSSVRAYIVV